MFVIMGATGHVGSAVVQALLEQGQEVVAVTHQPAHAARWSGTRVQVACADIHEPDTLRSVLRRGRRAFLLNPPADVRADTDEVERATVAKILQAVQGAGLEKVVAQSSGGAQPGERLGDLNVLWELEEGLRRQQSPAAINRAAFYMSNWDAQLPAMRETGTLTTPYPRTMALPMVDPRDLGRIAAQRLMSGLGDVGVRYVEGPQRYSALDVAEAFSRALKRPIGVHVVPRERWVHAFEQQGFSHDAARSYARMTAKTLQALEALDLPDDPIRGSTTLAQYAQDLVARA